MYNDTPLPGFGAEQGYRGPAVAKMVNISYRKLDHWTTKGLVKASVRGAEGSGTQRLYSYEDIVRLKVVCRLRDAGISLNKIELAMRQIDDKGIPLSEVTIAGDSNGNIFAIDNHDQVIDLLMSGQGVFFIAVEPVAGEVRAEVSHLRSETAYPIRAYDFGDQSFEAM